MVLSREYFTIPDKEDGVEDMCTEGNIQKFPSTNKNGGNNGQCIVDLRLHLHH